MKKFEEFLNKLEKKLYFFSNEEINLVLIDYKELYEEKLKSTKDEEEIINSFDKPEIIAQNYATELGIKTSIIKEWIVNTKKYVNKEFNKLVDLSEKQTSKDDLYIDKVFWKLMSILILFFKFVFKLIKMVVISMLVIVIVISITMYLLSFIFLKINDFTIFIRFFQTTLTVSFIVLLLMFISLIRGKNE